MKQVQEIDLGSYRKTIAFISEDTEVIVGPLEGNQRHVIYRSPYMHTEELVRVMPGRTEIRRVGDLTPSGQITAIFVQGYQ